LNSSIDALNSTVFFDGFEKWAENYMLDLEVSFKARVEKAGTKYIDSCIVDVEERLDKKLLAIKTEMKEQILAFFKEATDKMNDRETDTGVNCGQHNAQTCSLCPRIIGWPMKTVPDVITAVCQGDCVWCLGLCQPKMNICPEKFYTGNAQQQSVGSNIPSNVYSNPSGPQSPYHNPSMSYHNHPAQAVLPIG